MKKFKPTTLVVVFIVLCTITTTAFAWGNQAWFDTTWKFDRAVITLADSGFGSNKSFYVEGKVESWQDFENSDMIQVKIDGITYLTHSSNVVLISE